MTAARGAPAKAARGAPAKARGLEKHSVLIAGHRTSVSLEEPFWEALKEIAAAEKRPVANLVMEVDSGRGEINLSSALRLRVLAHYRGAPRPRRSRPRRVAPGPA